MSGGNRGDCCETTCECGTFCDGDYCGANMNWVMTPVSTTAGSLAVCTCTDLDVAMSIPGMPDSRTAESWNIGRPFYTGRDAKAGTNVCTWSATVITTSTCDPYAYAAFTDQVIHVYFGTDDKWYMAAEMAFSGISGATGENVRMGGEVEFDGGGAAMSCGTPGEGSPTFSLTIPITGFEGTTPSYICVMPTDFLIEGDPQ